MGRPGLRCFILVGREVVSCCLPALGLGAIGARAPEGAGGHSGARWHGYVGDEETAIGDYLGGRCGLPSEAARSRRINGGGAMKLASSPHELSTKFTIRPGT